LYNANFGEPELFRESYVIVDEGEGRDIEITRARRLVSCGH
jgi:hypothetical protein